MAFEDPDWPPFEQECLRLDSLAALVSVELLAGTRQGNVEDPGPGFWPGKLPNAYSIELTLSRPPYIFMNAVGTREDAKTLLHLPNCLRAPRHNQPSIP